MQQLVLVLYWISLHIDFHSYLFLYTTQEKTNPKEIMSKGNSLKYTKCFKFKI